MDGWDENYIKNLKELEEKNKDTDVKLNYDFITEHYFEMYEVAMNAGTIIPYRFNMIGLAYNGTEHNKPVKFQNFDPEVKQRLVKSYATRNQKTEKYMKDEIDPKEKYEKFLDKEIFDFIEEFPQYKDIIYHDD